MNTSSSPQMTETMTTPEDEEAANRMFMVGAVSGGIVVLLAMELLQYLVKQSGVWNPKMKRIPVRGKHLDELSSLDHTFIALNKLGTAVFMVCFYLYCRHESQMEWSWKDLSVWNTLVPLPMLYLVYDFFYTILHGTLHIPVLYKYIHKHHHHQKAPSRATMDAINVHPIEFFLGEYNHIFSMYLLCKFIMPLHLVGALLFVAIGGVLAGFNHTRYDVSWTIFNVITIYDSKVHDVHHRIPQSNYGQYTMFWDYIFGSFRPYNPNDRVVESAQLDPVTGKSWAYHQNSDESNTANHVVAVDKKTR